MRDEEAIAKEMHFFESQWRQYEESVENVGKSTGITQMKKGRYRTGNGK